MLPAAARVALGADATFSHWALGAEDEPALAATEAACRRAVVRTLPAPADPPTGSVDDCDEAVLARRLDDPDGWSDVTVRPELSELVALHNGRLDDRAEALVGPPREAVTAALAGAARDRGWCPEATSWQMSGHLWYRAGSALGWHTNTRVPGWRAYLTWVAEPGGSFFRYRDPRDGAVVTSWDTGLDLRLFHVSATDVFWHCVWAGTDRHSFGFRLVDTAPG